MVGNNEKKQFLDYLTEDSSACHVQVSDIRRSTTLKPLELNSFSQRSRAFVQIQNGCNAFCSYCIIPYARGRSRSVPVDDIIQQVNKLERSGHAEIVLTGIHIGQYGQEWKDGTDLLALLKKIEASGFRGRLRLGSVEPTELSPAFYQYVLRQEWICPHFHIPLQAGDDTILRQMNRHYTTAFYRQLVDDIRRSSADAAIGLDIITGFPGETDGQFERTLQFLNELPFTHLHVFPFSRRSGTPAAIMPNQIAGDVIKERARLLRQLGEEKHRAYMRQFIGQQVDVVIEGGEEDGRRKGLSPHYLPVWISSESVRPGELIKVRVVAQSEHGLEGQCPA